MLRHQQCTSVEGLQTVWYGSPEAAALHEARSQHFHPIHIGGLAAATARFGWSNIIVPGKPSQTNVTYSHEISFKSEFVDFYVMSGKFCNTVWPKLGQYSAVSNLKQH
jgi:hypothetical protein